MSRTIRTCPDCEQVSPGNSLFCPNCGVSLAGVNPTVVAATVDPDFFDVPAFLRNAERRKRKRNEPGSGAGWLWLGGLLIVIPILLTINIELSAVLWAGGLLLVSLGFWRMRHDRKLLTNAGLAFNLVAVAALGGIGYRTLNTPDPSGQASSLSAATATADAEVDSDTDDDSPGSALGTVAMFRGDAQHTGVHPGPIPNGNPDLKWRLDTAGEVYSSPVVSGGMVFLGAKSGYLYAVDEATGQDQWQFDIGDFVIVRSSPAVANQTVYIGGGYYLFALDQVTGREKWRLEIPYAGQSSPTISGGVVYVSSQEGHVYAVDANSGKQIWHFQIDGLIFASPSVAKGMIYVGSDDGNLYAINAETGKMKWKMATGGEVYSSAAVADGVIYVTSKNRQTYALYQDNGKVIWQHPIGGVSSPAIRRGVLYVGSDDGGLYALDAKTGEVKWLFPTGSPIVSSPAVVDDMVFVASGTTVYAVDVNTGRKVWNFATTDAIESSPAVVDGMVFIGSRDGFLYAIGGDNVDNSEPAETEVSSSSEGAPGSTGPTTR